MRKSIQVALLLTLSLCNLSAHADNNILRSQLPTSSSDLELSSGKGDTVPPVTYLTTSTNLTGKTIELADGRVLTNEQRDRIIQLQAENQMDLLGYTISAPVPALKQGQGATVTDYHYFILPEMQSDQPATVYYRPSGWGEDSDSLLTVVLYEINNTEVYRPVNIKKSWPAPTNAIFPAGGTLQSNNHIVSKDFELLKFWIRCYRDAGSYCSQQMNDMYLIMNPDLPKLGDEIIIK